VATYRTVIALVCGLAEVALALQTQDITLNTGDFYPGVELRGGQSLSYRVLLRAGQYFQVTIEQNGVDSEEVLIAPTGEIVAHADLPNAAYGPETVAAIAASTGEYQLSVRSPNPRAPLGHYTLRVEAIRDATADDRKRVEAERLVDQAMALGGKNTAAATAAAIEKNSQALAYFQSAGDRYRQGLTVNHIGLLQASTGDFRGALASYDHAAELFRASGDGHGEAVASNNAGGAYDVLGEIQSALDRYQRALGRYRIEGQRDLEGLELNNIGKLYAEQGDWQRASEFYQQALTLFEMSGNRRNEGSVLHNLGLASEYTDSSRAIDFLQQALKIRRETGDRAGEAVTFSGLAVIYNRLGQFKEALPYVEQARALYQTAGDRAEKVQASRTIGMIRAEIGQVDVAIPILEDARAKARDLGDKRSEGLTLEVLGFAHAAAGRPAEARESYQQALVFAERIGDSGDMARALQGLAKADLALGNLDAARQEAERGLASIEKVRSNAGGADERASYLSTAHETYELYIEVLMRLHQPSAALEASERSRARSMLDMLSESGADIRAGVDPALVAREREISNLLNAKGARLLPLLGGSDSRAADLQQEIRSLERDYQDVQAEIRKRSPRYAALTQPQTLAVKQIQEQVLDRDSLLLEYALGEKRSFLWAVGRDSVSAWELPAREKIEAGVQRFNERIAARSAAVSRTLSDMILAPAAAVLGGKRLAIVPDGALQRLPFAALTAPGSDEPLVAQHEIVMLPSASAISVLRTEISGRKPAPKMLAVFADPVFGPEDLRAGGTPAQYTPLPESSRILEHIAETGDKSTARLKISRLPYTAQEADQILNVVRSSTNLKAVGFQANRATAISGRLSDYRYLHFATHGYLDTERPSLSALVLAQINEKGEAEDGFLRVNDIYNARLFADLAVLSACQTGLGKEVRGEGLMGLTRAFLYAGVPRVVVSLWNVNDRATAELMAAFYRSMLREGKRPSAALREAQLELRKQKRWQSPYYWAAFVEHGEWR
jgi:CHAT domain-containing protein